MSVSSRDMATSKAMSSAAGCGVSSVEGGAKVEGDDHGDNDDDA